MAAIISVVGKSDSGKTTFLEKLIRVLKQKGYKVGAIKHDAHSFSIDHPGKDSWRLAQAGSDTVVILSPEKIALIKRTEQEMTLDQLSHMIGSDVDIVLTEGFKRADKPKIEISRSEISSTLLCEEKELIALVTNQNFNLNVPEFGLEDAEGVADLLAAKYIRSTSDSTEYQHPADHCD